MDQTGSHHARQEQLARVDTFLARWTAWKRKQTTERPPLSREFLEVWRAQLLAEDAGEDATRMTA